MQFADCKQLGFHFANANRFILELDFVNCQLDYASLYQLKLPKLRFHDCSLKDADFVEADLSGGTFDGCDLYAATFERTNLSGVDFRTAKNYNLDPEINTMTRAKFSIQGLAGLLDKHKLQIT
ncbi:pentapeptide repeat-containing protein [Bacteroidia bacterium]|nr:pentapeptide repeat-containing protein [Bacteroidia bacterium]